MSSSKSASISREPRAPLSKTIIRRNAKDMSHLFGHHDFVGSRQLGHLVTMVLEVERAYSRHTYIESWATDRVGKGVSVDGIVRCGLLLKKEEGNSKFVGFPGPPQSLAGSQPQPLTEFGRSFQLKRFLKTPIYRNLPPSLRKSPKFHRISIASSQLAV
jgi:hypothetical protein